MRSRADLALSRERWAQVGPIAEKPFCSLFIANPVQSPHLRELHMSMCTLRETEKSTYEGRTLKNSTLGTGLRIINAITRPTGARAPRAPKGHTATHEGIVYQGTTMCAW